MIRFWDNYFKANDNFYIQRRNSFKKVKGTKIPNKTLDVFFHQIKKGKLIFWRVSDAFSGLAITKLHKNPQGCIKEFNKIRAEHSEIKIKQSIIKQIKTNNGLSPRYIYMVNPTRRRLCGNLKK